MRYALRSLLKSPGFSLVALVTLALGIGVNSSMYSLMNTLLFASAPFPRPQTIVNLNGQTPQAEFLNLSVPEMDELRAHPANPFTLFAARSGTLETVTIPGQLPEQVQGTTAQAQLFQLLETPPLLGRTFTAAECVAGHDTVVLLTERFWREKFGARPDAIGQTLRISGRVFTIIGVLPEAYSSMFIFGESRYFRPLVPSDQQLTDRNRREFAVIGRLAPGTSMPQALAQLAPLSDRWAKDHPASYAAGYHLRMQLAGRVGGSANVAIITLQLGLAAAILALACANLANLQMARAVARVRDLAIRSALGATRWTLIRQQLTESVLLSIAGGGLGLLVARWSNDLIGRNIRLGLTSTLQMPLDGRVVAFTAAVSILAGLGFGLVPAWLASRTDVNEALKQQGRGSTGGRGQGWIRRILVVGQVALSLTLLSVAGMMIQGLNRTINFRPDWDSERILTANLQIEEAAYPVEKRRALYDDLIARLERLPGVEAAALANRLPVASGGGGADIFAEGQDSTAKDLPKAANYLVTPGFFKTLGIRVVDGRTFAPHVSPDSPDQVVVNQSLARHFWPNASPLGRRLGMRNADGTVTLREVIGVVADVDDAIQFATPSTHFQFYSNLTHTPWAYFQIALRGPNPGHFSQDLRRAVADINPDLAARFVWTLEDMRDQFLHNLVVINGVLVVFAVLGLALAGIGLYGIVANNVSQRMTEFGIRLALGASGLDLLRIVLVQSLILTVVGLGLGALGSFGLGLALRQALGPIIAQNQLILAGTSVVIFLVALGATWLPARRATTADPINALRAE
ncbi:MAG TPA: ABC transporter permease [Lacunisphaera sp.]|jgi:predicted permease|nr:ABC transporter permease [Lacunisphaera sp.]